MSAPNPRSVRFSPKARTDYTDIMLYTLQQWGAEQRATYSRQLTAALNNLADFSELGEKRDDISSGLRSWHAEQHVIYYRVTLRTVRVVRIRHVRADRLTASDL
jgi:toxin ParE1/3/4